MPETVDAQELTRRHEQERLADCLVQGPLTFDLAYAEDAGEKKRIAGDVVGAADIMIFPNLLSANLTVKAIMYTADCRFGGVLWGAAAPVVFMSRADTAHDAAQLPGADARHARSCGAPERRTPDPIVGRFRLSRGVAGSRLTPGPKPLHIHTN